MCIAAVGDNEQSGVEFAPAGVGLCRHPYPVLEHGEARDPRRAQQLRGGDSAEPAHERGADDAVRHDIAQCLLPGVASVEVGHASTAPVGNVDAQDGCGVVPRNVRPHADALEDAPRAVGQGDGALVEARLRVTVEGDGFDDRDPQARRA